jgi:hypothetical protein
LETIMACRGRLRSCLPLLVLGPIAAAASAPEPGTGAEGASGVPPGAIAVGDDLYQVPIGDDEDGCPMFRLFSPTRMVVQAIFWRTPEGEFTMDRSEAACPPPGESPAD